MNILILGRGFLAQHLTKFLRKKNYNVFAPNLNFDIRNTESIELTFLQKDFDICFNATGVSDYYSCENTPQYAFDVNCAGVLNILVNLELNHPATKFINLGSLRELDSYSWYSKTKRISREIVSYYRDIKGLWCTQLYLPNIVGPDQQKNLVIPKIIDYIKNLKLNNNNNNNNKLSLGNLDVDLNLLYIDNALDLIWKASQSKIPEDYLLSGTKINLQNFIIKVFHKFGIDNWKEYVQVDNELKRPDSNGYNSYIDLVGLSLKYQESIDLIINKLCRD
jgi:nucleoside-diphosphate-sugar epimerase